ncbi:uncharacterized protein LOC136028199 [Artemia franciscana]|uniref:XK-related protein n=1 Tax=Artemia franciscana TaxID=6661 RepID=A0AA88KZY7_ARTSF|nr:hypothetical protein QYM36_014190 [Artemia franciscana]KAK2708494.1 hypothetical protein QYM36_014190 [Artemia franciscana]
METSLTPIFSEGVSRRLQAAALFCSVALETALQVCVAYHYWQRLEWAAVVLSILITSSILVNVASIIYVHSSLDFSGRWFGKCICYILHLLLCGIAWRFLKLAFFYDRTDVREFAILRYVQSHLQTLPSVLVQIFLLYGSPWTTEAILLPAVVAGIQLASVSVTVVIASDIISDIEDPLYLSAQGSTSSSEPKKEISIIPPYINYGFRTVCFLWCRVLSFGVFTSELGYWIFAVIGLHWLGIFIWLLRNEDAFEMTKGQKLTKRALQALLLIFNWSPKLIDSGSFLNILEQEATVKVLNIAIYYAIVGSENAFMLSLWFHWARRNNPVVRLATVASCAGTFAFGLLSLALTTPECWMKPEDCAAYEISVVKEEKTPYSEIPTHSFCDYDSVYNSSSNSRNTNTIDPNMCGSSFIPEDDLPTYIAPRSISQFRDLSHRHIINTVNRTESVYRDPSTFTGSLSSVKHARITRIPPYRPTINYMLEQKKTRCHCKIFDEAGHSVGHRLNCPDAFQRLDPRVYVGTLMDHPLDLDPISPSTSYPEDSDNRSLSSITTDIESEVMYSTWPPSHYMPSMCQLFGTVRAPYHQNSFDYVHAWLVASTLPSRKGRPDKNTHENHFYNCRPSAFRIRKNLEVPV